MEDEKSTPLMQQYKEIKAKYTDAILFFRLGDFYEMFFDDAVLASKELGLTLTKRNKEKGVDVPLAGIPYHAVSPYIAKLVDNGHKIAICEQMEDPKLAKGLVKRDVIRIITPGTVIDPEYLDDKSNNYILAVKISNGKCSFAYLDVTTGEFKTSEIEGNNILFHLLGEINKINPREIIFESGTYDKYYEQLQKSLPNDKINISKIDIVKGSAQYLKDYFNVISLESFGIADKKNVIDISALLLKYVIDLQKGNEVPISKISFFNNTNIMELNLNTQRNLEIVDNFKDKSSVGTLVWVLDKCMTSMGSRLLKVFIKNPILDIDEINKRQNDVGSFIDNVLLREEIREKLKDVYDIERIIGKLVFGTENGKDLIALKVSIRNALEIEHLLGKNKILDINVEKLVEIHNMIEKAIVDDPPFSIREGGFIRDGYDKDLDGVRYISNNSKDYILEIEKREKEKTGIKNLKIGYNRVFGYYIEISRSYDGKVPQEYIRKQTLSNAERYIMPELKEYEEKILNAKEEIENREYKLFKDLTAKIKENRDILQQLAYKIAYLDIVTDFAYIAVKNSYVRPEVYSGGSIEIIGGRHPVVEQLIPPGEYVKNSVTFDENKKLIILTGPNMSGKSTYMKQIALIILMSHIGCYVPADYAKISVVDKIFTRIGARDDLMTGQSTFMLEMSEVANIVNSATEKSFIILDEIGRGTSTFDGISIATAITEYIHEKISAKTIFATHYHELTQLEEKLPKAVNYRIEVKETDDQVIFLREIVKGGADRSFGIEVAKLAGLPKEILTRSKEILSKLEERKELIESKINGKQLLLFNTDDSQETEEQKRKTQLMKQEEERERAQERAEREKEKLVLSALKGIDLDGLTPIDALLKLNELKKILNRG